MLVDTEKLENECKRICLSLFWLPHFPFALISTQRKWVSAFSWHCATKSAEVAGGEEGAIVASAKAHLDGLSHLEDWPPKPDAWLSPACCDGVVASGVASGRDLVTMGCSDDR